MLFFVVLAFVALGQQVVLSASLRFNFSSSIEQCAPLQILYSGFNSTDLIPTSLLLLPLNSTPFSIPIPNAGPSSTGLTVSFLPLAAGTQFIASLDDSSGDNAARVSDVFQVQPSSTNDDSCIPADSPPLFTLPTSVSQCAPFSIGYQDTAPSVRVFSPNGGSFSLNPSQNNVENQTAFYTLNVTHGSQVLLMAFPQNSSDSGLTTSLLTVEGDANSDASCIVVNAHKPTASSSPSSNTPVVSNKGLIIGLTVGGAVITLVAFMMIVYVVQDRRKRRRAAVNVSPDMLEKSSPASEPGFVQSQEYKLPMASPGLETYIPFPGYNLRYEPGFVTDPPYTSGDFSPSNSEFGPPPVPRGPDSQPTSMVISRSATIRSAKTASSINPYDIEEMLDVAAEEMPELPEPTAKQASGRRSPADLPALTIPRNVLTREHLRSPGDVPQAASMALSSYLGEKTVLYDSPEPVSSPSLSRSSVFSFASSSNFEILTRPTNTLIVTSSRQPSSRFSDASALQSAR